MAYKKMFEKVSFTNKDVNQVAKDMLVAIKELFIEYLPEYHEWESEEEYEIFEKKVFDIIKKKL